MFAVMSPVWEMDPNEEFYLLGMPEIVEFFRVRPEWNTVPDTVLFEDLGIYYLSHIRGLDGQKAMAHGGLVVHLERVTIRREYVLAVDLDRHTAQIASFVPIEA